MLVSILLAIVGLVLILVGADILVDGASATARRLGVSELVIGLTIVAIGTSLPELVVSLFGAIAGSSDLALGNVVGSNIINTGLILGLSLVIAPIVVTKETWKRDIPVNLLSALIVVGMVYYFGKTADSIVRIEGIVLLLCYIFYLYMCFRYKPAEEVEVAEEEHPESEKAIWIVVLMILGGFAGLVFGGRLFVDNVTKIARMAGLSDAIIAITVVALGTSLPELATSCVAAAKGKGQMALGNVLGSNISNIFLILGVTATVTPLKPYNIQHLDMTMLVVMAVVVLLCASTKKKKLGVLSGITLLSVWAVYTGWLIYGAL